MRSKYIELAYRIPNRISSLLLAVTTPGGPIWGNFSPVRVSVLFYSNLVVNSNMIPVERDLQSF